MIGKKESINSLPCCIIPVKASVRLVLLRIIQSSHYKASPSLSSCLESYTQSLPRLFVTPEGESEIDSGKLLKEIRYPDPTAGTPSNSPQHTISLAYDKKGRVKKKTDPSKDSNGNDATIHEFDYDDLGRLKSEDITVYRSDVDQSIEHIERSYNNLGRINSITTKDTNEDVVNEVAFDYNGFGQVVTSYQEHDGTKDDLTLSVDYAYTDDAKSYLEKLTYPDTTVENGVNALHYNYATGTQPGKNWAGFQESCLMLIPRMERI